MKLKHLALATALVSGFAASASAVAEPAGAWSVMSWSTPPSITSNVGLLCAGPATGSGGRSYPSRVPNTLRSRRIRKMAIPARTRS